MTETGPVHCVWKGEVLLLEDCQISRRKKEREKSNNNICLTLDSPCKYGIVYDTCMTNKKRREGESVVVFTSLTGPLLLYGVEVGGRPKCDIIL